MERLQILDIVVQSVLQTYFRNLLARLSTHSSFIRFKFLSYFQK